MTRKRGGRPGEIQEARFRNALGGAVAPVGLRDRILAALDEEDSARGRQPMKTKRAAPARRRAPSRRP
jgi:hypothetical protein